MKCEDHLECFVLHADQVAEHKSIKPFCLIDLFDNKTKFV